MEVRRLEDPTGNRYIQDRITRRFHDFIYVAEGRIETRRLYEPEAPINDILEELEILMLNELAIGIDISIMRGVFFAAREINRIPPFHVAADPIEKWPADIELRNEIVEESRAYIDNVVEDMRAGNVDQAMSRSELIARTETIRAFNEAARRRFIAYGITQYRFHANLGACTEPKRLADGTIVEGGCEQLHNQIFDVNDTVHRPPIHPLCRCTILPVG